MTVKGGTSPACAACKYQRRKCLSDCPLAPYFPANQSKIFQNVHRLFGVSNITKILGNLETKDQKEDAMKSIIYESDMRERFPVHGCSYIICQLRLQLQHAIDELRYVYAQLEIYRQQFNKQLGSPPRYSSPPQLEFGMYSNIDVSQAFQPPSLGNEMTNFAMNNQFFANENIGFYAESSDAMARPMLGFDPYCDMNCNQSITLQAQMDAYEIQVQQEQEQEISQDFEDMHFNTAADDRQSYIETKGACESSSESSLKDTTQSSGEQVSQSELRNAAACFSLTTVN
ncbi:LOB domain-containing protein [Abeliophyllum distichum]|uniref:LOB domain-containing protein n=1 Tax=Abeliophyllum distichum TaxID=126358 RepID=A0ABD1SH54_9LAMI